jgi:transaldolase
VRIQQSLERLARRRGTGNAIEHGAVAATSNPTIIEQVLKQERHLWEDRIDKLITDNPMRSDEDVM